MTGAIPHALRPILNFENPRSVARKDGAPWTLPTVSARAATTLQATGMTNSNDFLIGDPRPPIPGIAGVGAILPTTVKVWVELKPG